MYRKLNNVLIASAENVPKVYDSGHKVGFEEGKQAEYDAFWDAYQENGNRTNYAYAFAGLVGWKDVIFNPKYTIRAEGASWESLYFTFYQANISDVKAIMEKNGVTIDTKNARGLSASFEGCKTKNIPTLDVTNCEGFSRTFFGATNLESVVLENLSSDATFTNVFTNCSSLVNLRVSGTVGKNGLNLQWSTKLSKASIENIINCLSSTTSGLTVTLSQTAVNNVFTAEEWSALEATRQNWTISLV